MKAKAFILKASRMVDQLARLSQAKYVMKLDAHCAMDEGFDEQHTEGISDIRLIDDWPLPGASLVNYEGEKRKKLVIFYDNHFKLDSSVAA